MRAKDPGLGEGNGGPRRAYFFAPLVDLMRESRMLLEVWENAFVDQLNS